MCDINQTNEILTAIWREREVAKNDFTCIPRRSCWDGGLCIPVKCPSRSNYQEYFSLHFHQPVLKKKKKVGEDGRHNAGHSLATIFLRAWKGTETAQGQAEPRAPFITFPSLSVNSWESVPFWSLYPMGLTPSRIQQISGKGRRKSQRVISHEAGRWLSRNHRQGFRETERVQTGGRRLLLSSHWARSFP